LDNAITKSFTGNGKTRFFSRLGKTENGICLNGDMLCRDGKPVLDKKDILLPGEHNVENYMAAILAVEGLVDDETVCHVARTFGGVEHRLEYVRTVKGVKYYNGSIDSSPARTLAALSAFGNDYNGKIVLILGGKDKNLDFTELASVVCKRVKAVFISHDTEEKKVYTAITEDEGFDKDTLTVKVCEGFDDAFANASGFAREGDIVLLSPAMTSFDEFLNFEMRGKRFKTLVGELRED
jgi:UDP-N-acetylmuramoylalanine--D-glutamate ligase